MAKRNIPVDLFYASYTCDCTYELNSSTIVFVHNIRYVIAALQDRLQYELPDAGDL